MDRHIGIDLGTTYSAIARIDEYGRAVIVKCSNGEPLIPSAVYITPEGNEIAGSDAKDMMQAGEEDVAVFFKRYMGDPNTTFEYAGRQYTPTDLSAILLRKIKQEAEAALGGKVEYAVITVPAYFNDLQRNETMEAGRRAGLHVLRIINEPTAAAITYGINHTQNQRVLVYDLGGGTFDVTVLEVSSGTIKVLSTGGDHQLGGKDWDDELVKYVIEQFRLEHGLDISESLEAYNDLVYSCELLKKQLSSRNSSIISVRYQGERAKYTVTRAQFESMTDHLIRSTKSITERVLDESGQTWTSLDGVLLVGGSTRMPMVKDWVREMSGKEPLTGVNVDEAVALGAAVQASIEMERKAYGLGGASARRPGLGAAPTIKIVDVMSHSLGTVAVSEDKTCYINSIIIAKNKPIPAQESKPFLHHTRPGADNDLTVYLTQGESRDISATLVVGKYILHDIEHIDGKGTVIAIEYAYDENGMIAVHGRQTETGRELRVEKVALDDDMSWLYEKPKAASRPLSIVIALDLSGSMSGTPISKAQEAAREFVDQLAGGNTDLGNTRISILGFADRAKTICSQSTDPADIKKAIDKIKLGNYPTVGWGNGNNPLEDAYTELGARGHNNGGLLNIFRSDTDDTRDTGGTDSKKILIVLTDGVWSCTKQAIKWSDRYRTEGMDIIAIGFGGADRAFLERISTSSQNALLTDLDHLVESFGSIAQEISQSGGTGGLSWGGK